MITERWGRCRAGFAAECAAVGEKLAWLWRHDWRSDGQRGRYCARCDAQRPSRQGVAS